MPYSAETLFWQNVKYNTERAKARGKPKHRGFIKIMKPQVVLQRLSELGIRTTERTLQRYAKEGLIDKPETKSAGRGKGKVADYPEDTPAQFYASYKLLKGKSSGLRLDKKWVQQIRKDALGQENIYYEKAKKAGQNPTWGQQYNNFLENQEKSNNETDQLTHKVKESVKEWLFTKNRIERGYKLEDKILIEYGTDGIKRVTPSPANRDIIRLLS